MHSRNLQARVREAIETVGVTKTAAALGLSPEATLRLGGGFPVQDGTLALAESRLDRLPRRGANTA